MVHQNAFQKIRKLRFIRKALKMHSSVLKEDRQVHQCEAVRIRLIELTIKSFHLSTAKVWRCYETLNKIMAFSLPILSSINFRNLWQQDQKLLPNPIAVHPKDTVAPLIKSRV